MEKFDPYQFVTDNLEPRPFDKDKHRDGNVNYVHQCDVWTLIERIQSENNKKLNHKQSTDDALCDVCHLRNTRDCDDQCKYYPPEG